MTLILISGLIFNSYIVWIWSKYGVISSISDSYYYTDKPALFAFFIWGSAIPLMIVADTFLMQLAGGLLCFVGAAPAFREETEGKVHVFGALGGYILGAISLTVDFGLWYLSAIMVAFYFISKWLKLENQAWWVEILGFILIIIGLIIKVI